MTGPRLISDDDVAAVHAARAQRRRNERREQLTKQTGAWFVTVLLLELGVLQALGIATLIRRRCR